MSGVRRLEPQLMEKVWGSHHLSPWFSDSDQKIGEVWFEAGEEACPLLIKFLFTTEPLSVQVHPNDDYAARHENSRGKTEMWHILRADPGAAIALGVTRVLTPQELRESAETGAIQQMLNWVAVRPGDTFMIPAGTIHAIGAGIALCEIQQRSDVTYRLYDYGRPRALHIDQSLAVSDTGRFENYLRMETIQPGQTQLVRSKFFVTSKIEMDGDIALPAIQGTHETLIALLGHGTVAGQPYRQGEAWRVDLHRTEPLPLHSEGPSEWLHTYFPASAAC